MANALVPKHSNSSHRSRTYFHCYFQIWPHRSFKFLKKADNCQLKKTCFNLQSVSDSGALSTFLKPVICTNKFCVLDSAHCKCFWAAHTDFESWFCSQVNIIRSFEFYFILISSSKRSNSKILIYSIPIKRLHNADEQVLLSCSA